MHEYFTIGISGLLFAIAIYLALGNTKSVRVSLVAAFLVTGTGVLLASYRFTEVILKMAGAEVSGKIAKVETDVDQMRKLQNEMDVVVRQVKEFQGQLAEHAGIPTPTPVMVSLQETGTVHEEVTIRVIAPGPSPTATQSGDRPS